jgi:predicted 3-demethylubiquinone-9 3-methyltransferase (glyoxalase superfamily)
MAQKITPFLWFDSQAEEAMNYYLPLFNDSEVVDVSRYGEAEPGQVGSVTVVSFRLAGQQITAFNAGPHFTINPSVSFFVESDSEAEIDALWEKLAEGGMALMELGEYPFSKKYGWVQDRFGVSWQLGLSDRAQTITPFLMFVGDQFGRAEEAINYYASVFEEAQIDEIQHYGPGMHEPEGAVMFASFSLLGQPFMAMESSYEHKFAFTEATSFSIACEDQAEVDYYWETLSEGGEPSQCGWLKDRFGLSWQVVPRRLLELMGDEDREKGNRVMQAMLQMTKIEIDKLEEAYAGETRTEAAVGA